jgi:hypothetical protein
LVLSGWLSSRISYHHTQSLAFMGFNGWKLVSLCIVHLGIGLFSLLMVAQWVILLLLGPVFTSRCSWLTGEPRGLYPVCVKYHYKAKLEPYSSVHSLSCHGICHPVHEVNCGVLCVCTVGLRGFHH